MSPVSLGGLSFGQPLGLLALLALVPLAMAWGHAEVRHRRADRAYGGAPALRRGRNSRLARVRGALLVLAVVAAGLGAAQPRWGSTEAPVQRRGVDVAVALDISRSMQATDVTPTRAEAAARGLREMLRHQSGNRVGLVTFGGNAFARAPLTLDLDALSQLVTRAQGETALVRGGTDVGAAISTALSLLDVPDRASTQVIVLISDGEDLGQNATGAIAAAKRDGVRVFTVIAGTEAGATVPAAPNETPGAPVTSRADRSGLQRIAQETGGTLRDVSTLPGLAVELARLQQTALDADTERIPIERFQWLLGVAFVLLLVHTLLPTATGTALRMPRAQRNARGMFARLVKRTAAAAGLLAALLLAGCGGTEAYRFAREGDESYAVKDYESALTSYNAAGLLARDDPAIDYNLANTLHMLGRYEDSSKSAREALTAARAGSLFAYAQYTLGSNAFRSDALTDARDAFIAVLQRDPADADARHNLEVILRRLQPPAPPQPQQPNTASPTPGPNDPNGAGGGQPAPGQQPGQPNPSGTPQSGAPGQGGQPTQPGNGQGSGGQLSPGAALERALAGIEDGLTAEEALAILDAARRASERGTVRDPSGGVQDPNNR